MRVDQPTTYRVEKMGRCHKLLPPAFKPFKKESSKHVLLGVFIRIRLQYSFKAAIEKAPRFLIPL